MSTCRGVIVCLASCLKCECASKRFQPGEGHSWAFSVITNPRSSFQALVARCRWWHGRALITHLCLHIIITAAPGCSGATDTPTDLSRDIISEHQQQPSSATGNSADLLSAASNYPVISPARSWAAHRRNGNRSSNSYRWALAVWDSGGVKSVVHHYYYCYTLWSIKSGDNKREEMRGAKKVLFW